MSQRRPVRVDERFLELLDAQLGQERGPNGEPSSTDFLLVELPPIAESVATRWETLQSPVAERPEYRSVLSVGTLVARILVTGVLEADGSVTLMSVRLDADASYFLEI